MSTKTPTQTKRNEKKSAENNLSRDLLIPRSTHPQTEMDPEPRVIARRLRLTLHHKLPLFCFAEENKQNSWVRAQNARVQWP